MKLFVFRTLNKVTVLLTKRISLKTVAIEIDRASLSHIWYPSVLPSCVVSTQSCNQIFTVRQRSCGKVIFSVVSASHSVQGHHVTIACDALDLTSSHQMSAPVGGSSCEHYPWCIGPHCTGPPASDFWWPRLETCSNLLTWGPPLVLTSGGYCWQAGSTHSSGMLSFKIWKQCVISCWYLLHKLLIRSDPHM